MIGTLTDVVAIMAGLECVLLLTIVIIRVLLRRRQRREHRFRPEAEEMLAAYLAGGISLPAAADQKDRMILRAVALEALVDLRGNELDRLVGPPEHLGFIDDACSGPASPREL